VTYGGRIDPSKSGSTTSASKRRAELAAV